MIEHLKYLWFFLNLNFYNSCEYKSDTIYNTLEKYLLQNDKGEKKNVCAYPAYCVTFSKTHSPLIISLMILGCLKS